MDTTQRTITWDFDPDTSGRLAHCVAVGQGRHVFDEYRIYDLVAIRWGKDAWFMKDCLKPGTKRFELEFPDRMYGSRRQYTTLKAAIRAAENKEAR